MDDVRPTGMAPRLLTPTDVPGEVFTDIPARVRAVAAERPEAIAVIDGETSLTAAALADAMDRIAGWLTDEGVAPGCVVATLGGVTADHVALCLGTLAAGAALGLLPAAAHPDQIAHMAANSGARLLFADAGAMAVAQGLDGPAIHAMDGVIAATAGHAPAPPRTLAPDDLIDIIYSSGTTGAPKGIEHDALFRSRQVARFGRFGFRPGSVSLVSTPIYSNTTIVALLPALCLGGTVVLMRKFDEAGWLALAERHRVTHAMMVPVQYRRLLDHPDFDRTDLSAFEAKLSSSSPMPVDLSREVLARWPGRLINIYGMTEGGVSTTLDCSAHPDKLHTVGRAVANGEIRIIGEDGSALPVGEVGEVVGRSPTVMRGYRNAPDKTAELIWRSPEGLTFMRSGDMGRLDADGFLTLLDRRRDMIISGGFNIFAIDLEAVLARHPAVAECAVVGVPSARWGETPAGCVVLRAGAEATAPEIRDWVNAQLGKNQRLSGVAVMETLPRNALGKVLKRALRERLAGVPA